MPDRRGAQERVDASGLRGQQCPCQSIGPGPELIGHAEQLNTGQLQTGHLYAMGHGRQIRVLRVAEVETYDDGVGTQLLREDQFLVVAVTYRQGQFHAVAPMFSRLCISPRK